MSAAHGFCFQRRSPLRLGTRRIVMFPHDARGRGFTPQRPLRRADGSRRGVVFLDGRSRRRTSDAPSPAGVPGGAMSTGVGPRSRMRSQVETRKSRPTPPSRVNGSLGLALARSTFSLRSFSSGSATRSGRSRGSVPFGTQPHERRTKASAVSPTHEAQRVPQSPRCCSALLSKRGTSSGVSGSVPGTSRSPAVPCRQGDRSDRAPSDPCVRKRCRPALARPSRSPPTSSRTDTFVIDG